MRRADTNIHFRAESKEHRLIDRAAEIAGKTISAFVRDAAMAEAKRVILSDSMRQVMAINPEPCTQLYE